jgi:hypothetical protein
LVHVPELSMWGPQTRCAGFRVPTRQGKLYLAAASRIPFSVLLTHQEPKWREGQGPQISGLCKEEKAGARLWEGAPNAAERSCFKYLPP